MAPFIQTLTEDVLTPLAAEEEASSHYTFGLDVVSWLSVATARPVPCIVALASVPISLPLIGLTQLVQYLVVCHVANLTPGELRSWLSGSTGHPQGIVSAVVIAASGAFEELANNSHKAVKWLLIALSTYNCILNDARLWRNSNPTLTRQTNIPQLSPSFKCQWAEDFRHHWSSQGFIQFRHELGEG